MRKKYGKYYNELLNSSQPTPQLNLSSYWLLVGVRIILTLLPQNGYIHPDEYFQSVEVVAGDIFDVETIRPWEFNTTFPIRSIVLPYLTVGLPYFFLKSIAPFITLWLNVNIKTPYVLLILPRLVSCLLSFVCDYSLYKICCAYGQNYRTRLITFASSYVVLVYGTRTFSNTIEMVLMSLLLYLVADCMKFSDQIISQDEYLSDKYKAAVTPGEKVKFFKLRSALPNHSLSHCFAISSLTVIGIFNRPTFIAFAFPPVFFWLQRGLGSKTVGLAHFHMRIITFIFSGLPVAIIFVMVDSFYYGYLTVNEILMLKINLDNFVVAPANFLMYNSKVANLAAHGLHPRFLHFLINLPLLYNVLAVVGLFAFIRMIYSGVRGKLSGLPRIQSILGLMTTSFIIPVIALSIFPHQEPRFLIPVTLPLIFLHSQRIRHIRNEDEHGEDGGGKIYFGKKRRDILLCLWYLCNINLTLFYGFLHQGGIYFLADNFAQELQTKPRLTALHLVTSHTYTLPLSLLQISSSKHSHFNKQTGKRYRLAKEFHSYEMSGAPLQEVVFKLETLLNSCEVKWKTKKLDYRLYATMPHSLIKEFNYLTKNSSFSYSIMKIFYPHVSTEAFPTFFDPINCSREDQFFERCEESFYHSPLKYLSNIFQQFGLVLIRLQLSGH